MRRFVAACAALALTACITDTVTIPGRTATGGTGTTNGIAGTYNMVTMGGAPLPYVFMLSGADHYDLMDDALTMTDTGTWSEIWHERHVVGGVTNVLAFTDGGTYTRTTSGALTFLSPSHAAFVGTYNGSNTITLTGLSPSGASVPQVLTKQ